MITTARASKTRRRSWNTFSTQFKTTPRICTTTDATDVTKWMCQSLAYQGVTGTGAWREVFSHCGLSREPHNLTTEHTRSLLSHLSLLNTKTSNGRFSIFNHFLSISSALPTVPKQSLNGTYVILRPIFTHHPDPEETFLWNYHPLF